MYPTVPSMIPGCVRATRVIAALGRVGSDRNLGEAEIEHFDEAVGTEHDILRLDVAMDQAGGVGGVERRRDLDRDVERFVDTHRPALQALPKCFAIDELGDEVVQSLMLAEFVDRQDSGMVEGGRRQRFAFETLDDVVVHEIAGDDFDRDRPLQACVAPAIDLAHPAGADETEHLVTVRCACPSLPSCLDHEGRIIPVARDRGGSVECTHGLEMTMRSQPSTVTARVGVLVMLFVTASSPYGQTSSAAQSSAPAPQSSTTTQTSQERLTQLQARVAELEQSAGPTDPALATALNDLAVFYFTQADYAAAEPLLRRTLAIREAALGADAPQTAQAINNLAQVLQERGNYVEAEPLLERSLKSTRLCAVRIILTSRPR